MKTIPIDKITVEKNVRGIPDGIDPNCSWDDLPDGPLKQGIAELAESIKELGLLSNPAVKEMGKDNYRIIFGWRRLMALKLNGATMVSAHVVKGRKSDEFYMQLAENIQREELSTLDIAMAIKTMKEELGILQADIAKKLNKSEAWVSMHLRIADSDVSLHSAIEDGSISASGARHVASLKKEEQSAVINHIVDESNALGHESAPVSIVQKHVDHTKKNRGKSEKKKTSIPKTGSVRVSKKEKRFREQAPGIISAFLSEQYGETRPGKQVEVALDLFLSFLHKQDRLVFPRS